MADGSISGNSGKAVEESEEMTLFYYSLSPSYFHSPPRRFPPSPPLEFPNWPPLPPSSDSRLVLPSAFDGSQQPMENPHQFTTNSLPLLPPPPQNQQQVISPAPRHQDNVSKQYFLVIEIEVDRAVSEALEHLLEGWIHTLRFTLADVSGAERAAVSEVLGAAVQEAIRAAVQEALGAAVQEAMWAAVLAAVREAVREAVPAVRLSAGREAVLEAVREAVRAAVPAARMAAEPAARLAAEPAAERALSAAKFAALEAAEQLVEPAAQLAAGSEVVSVATREAFSCLLQCWTDVLNNSRGEQSIRIPCEGLNMVVRQTHGGYQVTEIGRTWHRLCTFDNAEEVALRFERTDFKLRGENDLLNFPNLFLYQNRAAESTAPLRTEFPPPPAQQRNPEEDPGSGRSEAMAAAVDNEVEGTGEGERRKILEIENKKTRGVRITIPLEDIQKYSEMSLVDAAKNLNVSRSTLKRVCRDYEILRWPPRSKIIKQNPQLNSNHLQHGPSNQASSSTVVHTNQPQLSYAEKQPDTDPDIEKRLPSFMQPNDIVTIKARYVNNLTIRFPISLQSSGLVELEQEVAKRLDLEAGTYHIKYKDEENDLILIACDEDFQDYARLKGTSLIEVFLEPKHAAN